MSINSISRGCLKVISSAVSIHLLMNSMLHSTLSQFHVLFIKYYKNKLTKPEILFINILAIYSLHLKDSANTKEKIYKVDH